MVRTPRFALNVSGSVLSLPDDFGALEALVASYTTSCDGPLPSIAIVSLAQRLAPLFGGAAHLEFSASRTAFRFRGVRQSASDASPSAGSGDAPGECAI